jgi:hypothetical protein
METYKYTHLYLNT